MAVIAYRKLEISYRIHSIDSADRQDYERELRDKIEKLLRQKTMQRRHRLTYVDDIYVAIEGQSVT